MRVLVGKNALLECSSPAIAGQNLDWNKSLKISLYKKSQEGSFVLNLSTLCLFKLKKASDNPLNSWISFTCPVLPLLFLPGFQQYLSLASACKLKVEKLSDIFLAAPWMLTMVSR